MLDMVCCGPGRLNMSSPPPASPALSPQQPRDVGAGGANAADAGGAGGAGDGGDVDGVDVPGTYEETSLTSLPNDHAHTLRNDEQLHSLQAELMDVSVGLH